MKRYIFPAMLAALLAFTGAFAEENSGNTSVATQEWHAYVDTLAPIGERMATKMSNPEDPQLRQELYRMIFMGMSEAYMALFLGDTEHPDFWPVWNQAYNFFVPNPDDTYYLAALAPDGVYKISGFRGTVRIADFEIAGGPLVPFGTGTLGPVFANYDLDRLHINKKDGSFEVILSRERPAGYKGDWWKLDPQATFMMVRQISYDWLRETDGRFAIERLDRPAIKPRLSAQEIEAKLKQIGVFAETWTNLGLKWPRNYRDKGLVNKVIVHDLNSIGGLSTQKYIEGLFEIAPDEALIYETEVPKQCRYWNLQLGDMMWSGLDYLNRQTSLNGHTARRDKDGKFRAVISAADPGVPNWLDNNGYTKGVIFGRWTDCSSGPTPTVTKVKLAELRKYLPADTPVVSAAARDASLRLRRKGGQLRRRW